MGFGVSEELEVIKAEMIKKLSDNKREVNDYFEKYNKDTFDEECERELLDINKYFDEALNFIKNSNYFYTSIRSFIVKTVLDNSDIIIYDYKLNPVRELENIAHNLLILLRAMNTEIDKGKLLERNKEITEELNDILIKKEELEKNLSEIEIIKDDLKNKKVNEIFEDDSIKFKKIARIYEFLFYLIVLVAGLYFLGLTFYVVGFDAKYLSIGFPEKIHGNISAEFYIQKISFLVLSTTLAAFLLKRSFMNRRLADEAYRTAKELDALPRYMEGMPDEMKEKIRFDLAYKYFGNGIHHDSYTGGENLMHENIKANTEFVKVVKGVPSTTDESKADKDKNE